MPWNSPGQRLVDCHDFQLQRPEIRCLELHQPGPDEGEEICVPDLAASFQNAVVDVLVSRAVAAAKEYG